MALKDWPAQADADLAFTWLGHAAYMVEMEGKFVLLDPMLGPNPSPVYGTGPARLHPAPCQPADMPVADVIILSHDHYDHLDKQTVKALASTAKLFVVPVGVGPWLKRYGVPNAKIREMDWGETLDWMGLHITSLPARHFSGRGLTDRNKTLWSSYSIRGEKRRLYFTGDTGAQDEAFAKIGEAYGPFDASIMAIGAYDSLWHDIHLDPEEAVGSHRLLDGGLFIPCHWATFDLALHPWGEPAERLEKAVAGTSIALAWPKVGERFTLAKPPTQPWWKALVRPLNSVEAGS